MHGAPQVRAQSITEAGLDDSLRDAQELARSLPTDAERCTVVMPSRVASSERTLVSLVSQVDHLPWSLASNVQAYARAEVTPRGDRRRVVELIRFAGGSRATLRQDLAQHARQPLSWDDEPGRCDDPLTCVPIRAQFIDARTVRIQTGDWPYGSDVAGSNCTQLLADVRGAVEVSARRGLGASELGAVERWLSVTETGLSRVERRSYADAAAAERARVKELAGYHDLPALGGVPVQAQVAVAGLTLLQRADVSWDDLRLVVQDRERLDQALAAGDTARIDRDEDVDINDVALVRGHVDARVAAIAREQPGQQQQSLESLRTLLLRARQRSPSDEGLARRLFTLLMVGFDAPGKAQAVAASMIQKGSAQRASWELALRSALAHVNEGELRAQLAHAHHLSAPEAARMATSLVSSVQRGDDYEHAEWAFMMARSLGARAHATRLVAVPALSIGPGLCTRMLAMLASAAGADTEDSAFGVHVLVTGGEFDATATAPEAGLWVQRTDALGAPAVVLAATSWDPAQLQRLAQSLDVKAQAPTVEVWVAFDPLQRPDRRGTLVRLGFQRSERGLVLARVSKNLSHVRWTKLLREVAEPLSRLQGAVFPPDTLTIEGGSEHELSVWAAAAARVDGVTCTVDGSALQCRGALHDNLAAERALRAVVRASLGPEVRIFTSGAD